MKNKRAAHYVDVLDINKNANCRFAGNRQAGSRLAVFSRTLNRLMEEKQISQEDMSRDLNISTGVLSNYRNGKSEPGLTKLISMAEYLGVDCHYLMTGVSSANRTLAADTGLSESAIEFLKLVNRNGDAEEKRSIRLINRILDYKPSDLKKEEHHFLTLFTMLDQYITSADVRRRLHREYVPGPEDSPRTAAREQKADDFARRHVIAEAGRNAMEMMDFAKLYREAKLTEIRNALDAFLKAETVRICK